MITERTPHTHSFDADIYPKSSSGFTDFGLTTYVLVSSPLLVYV
jgi:hypothetical protein